VPHEGRCAGRLVVRRRLLTRLANAGMFRVAPLLTLILHVDSDLPSRQAAVARAEVSVRLGLSSLARSQGVRLRHWRTATALR
jgi:hypothetical protein